MSEIGIDEIRRTAGDRPSDRVMIAAINAVAAIVGDDHREIMAALLGAYATVACATGSGDEELQRGIGDLSLAIMALADTTEGRTQ